VQARIVGVERFDEPQTVGIGVNRQAPGDIDFGGADDIVSNRRVVRQDEALKGGLQVRQAFQATSLAVIAAMRRA
jgi:hypothetical protein